MSPFNYRYRAGRTDQQTAVLAAFLVAQDGIDRAEAILRVRSLTPTGKAALWALRLQWNLRPRTRT